MAIEQWIAVIRAETDGCLWDGMYALRFNVFLNLAAIFPVIKALVTQQK